VDWRTRAEQDGISTRTFYRLRKRLSAAGKIRVPAPRRVATDFGSMNTSCAKMPKWLSPVFTRGGSTCANCAKITFGTDTLPPVPQCHILIDMALWHGTGV